MHCFKRAVSCVLRDLCCARRARGAWMGPLATLVLACAAQATTYYVRKTGNNSNAGTSPASAWLTIDKAADTAVAGDVVYVGAGTYSEQVTPSQDGTAASPIRFVADTTGAMSGDAGSVIVMFTAPSLELSQDDYLSFVNFRFTASNQDVVRFSQSVGCSLVDCEIYSAPNTGVEIDTNSSVSLVGCTVRNSGHEGITLSSNCSVTLTECIIRNNARDGIRPDHTNAVVNATRCMIYSNGQDGVEIDRGSVTLTNCLLHSNSINGIRVGSHASAALTAWHCTLSGNSSDGIYQQGGTAAIHNSIIASSADDALDRDGGTMTHTYNILFGSGHLACEGTTMQAGEQAVNPQLVGGGNYALASSSPAVNAGIDATAFTTLDIDEKARPIGAGWDIGAYEYGVASLFANVSGATGFGGQTTSDETYGSGWHWADFDNDGDLDAIATGNTAKFYSNVNAGASFLTSTFGGGDVRRQGALLDYDNDGDVDFFAACVGSYDAEAWFENNGSASFTNRGNAGLSQPVNNENVAVVDTNWDGWSDIVILSGDNGNWVGVRQAGSGSSLVPSNDTAYGLGESGDFGNGDYVSAGDANNDGHLDLFYNYGSGKLFLSDGDGTFTEGSYGISVVTGGSDKFGSAWADYDNDGDADLFVPRRAAGSASSLWRNAAGTFTNVAASAGITDTSGHRACCWGDYNNDGRLDLFITTGAGGILYRNNGGGSFTVATDGPALTGNCHDAVFVDYDNDGDLDLAVSREDTSNILFRSAVNNQNYLKVRVIGTGTGGTNRAAIGVRVELYQSDGVTLVARRHVGVARGWAGTEPLWLHFGGVNPAQTYIVRAYFLAGTQSVSVVPQNASTTIGSTSIAQMLTIVEISNPTFQVNQWREIEPNSQ